MNRPADTLWWLDPPAKRRRGWAPLVWVVMWVAGDDAVRIGTCGHRHPDASSAMACPWEPDPLPPVGAGLVVYVRDPEYRAPGQVIREARQPREQLRMSWALEVQT